MINTELQTATSGGEDSLHESVLVLLVCAKLLL